MELTYYWALYGLGLYVACKILDWIVRLPHIGHLDQRYFFITGCDTGFGHAIAKKLDKQGCHVFAACFTEKGEIELKKECTPQLVTVHLDVTDHSSVLKAYHFVKNNLPTDKGLSGILNNAGVPSMGQAEWFQLKDYQKTLSVNLLGQIDVTTTFLPLVKKARGRVVNTASVAGRFSMMGNAPYNISKYGVEAFSDVLRREMRPFKVGVHIIEPGVHKTSLLEIESVKRMLSVIWDQTSQETKDQYGQHYFENFIDFLQSSTTFIPSDITGVINAYEHALTGLFPRARYVVGVDAKYIFLQFQKLPEWLSDLILSKLQEAVGNIPAGAID